MKQSRLVSFVESVINVASGFLLALFLWQGVLAPAFGIPMTLGENIIITSVFTTASVIRGYLWRRFFNANLHRALAQRLTRPR
jgi:hypothetical protein